MDDDSGPSPETLEQYTARADLPRHSLLYDTLYAIRGAVDDFAQVVLRNDGAGTTCQPEKTNSPVWCINWYVSLHENVNSLGIAAINFLKPFFRVIFEIAQPPAMGRSPDYAPSGIPGYSGVDNNERAHKLEARCRKALMKSLCPMDGIPFLRVRNRARHHRSHFQGNGDILLALSMTEGVRLLKMPIGTVPHEDPERSERHHQSRPESLGVEHQAARRQVLLSSQQFAQRYIYTTILRAIHDHRSACRDRP